MCDCGAWEKETVSGLGIFLIILSAVFTIFGALALAIYMDSNLGTLVAAGGFLLGAFVVPVVLSKKFPKKTVWLHRS